MNTNSESNTKPCIELLNDINDINNLDVGNRVGVYMVFKVDEDSNGNKIFVGEPVNPDDTSTSTSITKVIDQNTFNKISKFYTRLDMYEIFKDPNKTANSFNFRLSLWFKVTVPTGLEQKDLYECRWNEKNERKFTRLGKISYFYIQKMPNSVMGHEHSLNVFSVKYTNDKGELNNIQDIHHVHLYVNNSADLGGGTRYLRSKRRKPNRHKSQKKKKVN